MTGGEEWFCNGREKYIKSTSPSTAELLIIAKSQSIPMGELPVLVADHSICHIGQNRVVLSGTPGPRLMRIHLVRNSTSANFGKTPKIFT